MSGRQVSTTAIVGLAGLALMMTSAATGSAGTWTLTVRGQAENPGETPVVARVDAAIPPGEYHLLADDGSPLAETVRVFHDHGGSYLAFVLKRLPAGRDLTFAFGDDTRAERRQGGVTFDREGTNVKVLLRGSPLLEHHTDLASKPYDFPVIGPTGDRFTRAYPMETDVPGETRDHPHQRSFWFTHGSVNGLDFWASDPLNKSKANFGSIRETSSAVIASGRAVGMLRTTDDWLGPDGKVVCQDERVLHVYETGAVRILDFDITIKASNGPVTFGDTKEGMFGLRLASSMDVDRKKGGKITNAEGVTDAAAWGKASPWVDYTGPVAGKTVGVAILNHPSSFRYPTTWHVRTYGLFAANPFGWHDFGRKESGQHVVPAGESIRFGYRVILHEGDTPSAHLLEAFKAYAEPPKVTVTGG
jgi:hypothetical protein